jgi:hypothetical protein
MPLLLQLLISSAIYLPSLPFTYGLYRDIAALRTRVGLSGIPVPLYLLGTYVPVLNCVTAVVLFSLGQHRLNEYLDAAAAGQAPKARLAAGEVLSVVVGALATALYVVAVWLLRPPEEFDAGWAERFARQPPLSDQELLVVALVIGAVCGLAPLLIGIVRGQPRLGFGGLIVCLIAGLGFGAFGALPAAALFSWRITRRSSRAGSSVGEKPRVRRARAGPSPPTDPPSDSAPGGT